MSRLPRPQAYCLDCDVAIYHRAIRCRSCAGKAKVSKPIRKDPTPEEIAAMCKKIREENEAAGIIREKAPANLSDRIYRAHFRD